MLRTPASLSIESIRHLQHDHWAIATAFIFLIAAFAFAAFIARRRLNIAAIWSKKLSERGDRTENEILHAVGQMMFPVRILMGGIVVFTLLSLPILKNFTFETVATGACALMFAFLAVQINREQKLLFAIRKIDPKKVKANTLAVRTFFGVFFAISFSFGLASLITAVRETIFPLSGTLGLVFHTVEFLGLLIAGQMLVAPLIVRTMLPSEKPSTETELRTAKIVTDAFTKLGLNAPQVRILKLDGLRSYNALIAGANRAPGPFRQLVLISQSDELGLTEKETQAIINHELAHGFLLHIPVRLVASMVIWVMGLLPIIGLSAYANHEVATLYTPAIMAAFFIFIHPLILGRLVREQEIQADEFAVVRLGSSAHDLISALSKATLASGGLLDRKPPGAWLNSAAAHPTVLEREAILQRLEQSHVDYFKQSHAIRIKQGADLSKSRAIRHLLKDGAWRSIAAVNVTLLVLVSVSVISAKKSPSQSRTPASIESALNAENDAQLNSKKAIRTESLDDHSSDLSL